MKNKNCIFWAFLLIIFAASPMGVRAERGVASYYHNKFHGRKMANGDRYHRDSLTCAHRRYPFGTCLRVTNTRNGKSVVVKVTDRGPYSKRYTIDLSMAAARQLDYIAAGYTPVEITQVSPETGGIVPFPIEEEEDWDIELDFVPAAQYPLPQWSKDTEM